MLKSIEEELEDCRKRFEGVGVGALVWCCHHSIELEMLTELPEARIAYIMREKSVDERARRLYEFAPVRGELPVQVIKARAEWDKALAERERPAPSGTRPPPSGTRSAPGCSRPPPS